MLLMRYQNSTSLIIIVPNGLSLKNHVKGVEQKTRYLVHVGKIMLTKEQKYLRSHYLCVVNPQKCKVYDFKKKKQVKWQRTWGGVTSSPKKQWPTFGFVCPICEKADSSAKHFLVDGVSMCETCALSKIIPKRYSKEEKWNWMMDWCKSNGFPPAQSWAWDKAKREFEKFKRGIS
jgi:hypothetical protein